MSRFHFLSDALGVYLTDQDRRAARVVAIVALALLATCILGFVLALRWNQPELLVTLGIGAALFLLAAQLPRLGFLRAAGSLIVYTGLGLVTVSAVLGQGIHDYVIMGYPGVVVVSSLMGRSRGFFVLSAAAAILGLTGLAVGEATGWFVPYPAEIPDWTDWTLIVTFMLVTSLAVILLVNDLQKSLADARRELEDRQRAESALRESEACYRALFEHAGDYVLLTTLGADGVPVIVDANEAAARAHGYSSQELAGQPITLIDPAVTRTAAANRVPALQADQPLLFEARHYRKDGTWFDVEVKLTPVHVGGRMLTLGVERDITERQRASHALRESEAHLREAQSLAHLGHWEHDHATGEVLWSDELYRIHGFDPAGPPPTWDVFQRRLHPEDRAEMIARFEMALQPAEHSFVKEYRTVRDDGIVRHIRLHLRTDCDPASGRWRTFGTDQDVTELRQSDEKFSKAFSAGPVALAITRMHDGKLLEVNHAFERLTGYGREEAVGRTAFELRLWADESKRDAFMPAILRDGHITQREVPFRFQDGELHLCDYSADSLELGGEVCVLAALVDTTDRLMAEVERKKLTAQLFQAQKLESIGTLAAGIAHDFNNILAIIVGNTDLLECAPADQAEVAESVASIKTASARGVHLVRQLLTIARKTDTHRASVKVNQLVSEAVTLIGETFPKTIMVSFDLDPALPTVNADQNQLHQVLLNLCVNARDAMSAGGTLGFATRTVPGRDIRDRWTEADAPSYVCISVQDTGTGMDEETVRHIFDPFFTTKEVGKGTGLGLAVVQGIVQAHSGFIDVASRVGTGTTFNVFLPGTESTAVSEALDERTLANVRGGHETILLVEDEQLVRQFVAALMTRKGYRVITARDGLDGVETFQRCQHEIDLVVSDFGLPECDGQEVYRRIREVDPARPFVLMSGFVEPEKRASFMAMGIREVIAKPFNGVAFLTTVRTVLDKAV